MFQKFSQETHSSKITSNFILEIYYNWHLFNSCEMKIQKYIQWTLLSELKILQKFVIQIFTATKTFELILFEIKKSQMRNLPKATIYNQQYGNDKSGQSRRIHNRKCPVKNIHWNIRQELIICTCITKYRLSQIWNLYSLRKSTLLFQWTELLCPD